MKILRYPKTSPVCEKCRRAAAMEFVTSAPDFMVSARGYCGCGHVEEMGWLQENDVLLLRGTGDQEPQLEGRRVAASAPHGEDCAVGVPRSFPAVPVCAGTFKL